MRLMIITQNYTQRNKYSSKLQIVREVTTDFITPFSKASFFCMSYPCNI